MTYWSGSIKAVERETLLKMVEILIEDDPSELRDCLTSICIIDDDGNFNGLRISTDELLQIIKTAAESGESDRDLVEYLPPAMRKLEGSFIKRRPRSRDIDEKLEMLEMKEHSPPFIKDSQLNHHDKYRLFERYKENVEIGNSTENARKVVAVFYDPKDETVKDRAKVMRQVLRQLQPDELAVLRKCTDLWEMRDEMRELISEPKGQGTNKQADPHVEACHELVPSKPV